MVNSTQAMALAYLGRITAAREKIRECLARLLGSSNHDLELGVLLSEARCLIEENKAQEGAEMAGFVVNHPLTWNEMRFQGEAFLGELAAVLSESDLDAAVHRYKDREIGEMVDAWFEKYG